MHYIVLIKHFINKKGQFKGQLLHLIMSKFVFKEPTIYPSEADGYKDSKGKLITKWFIRYRITFDNGTTEYRKEYGKSYRSALNTIKNLKAKREEALILLALVKNDLSNGIDPKVREQESLKHTLKLIREAEQYNYKLIFTQWFNYKNYTNPIPSKVLSAKNIKILHLNQFLPYLSSIGKDGDIRKITEDDIAHFIRGKYDSGIWVAKTANVNCGWISGVFTYAYRVLKIISQNPMEHILPIREDKIILKDGKQTLKVKKEIRFCIFNDTELNLIRKHWEGTKYFVITQIIFLVYIRFSEIFRLKLEHLDLVNGYFIIPANIAKGQRDGTTAKVKMFGKLKEIILDYIKENFGDDLNDDYYLFHSAYNKFQPLQYSAFHRKWLAMGKSILKIDGVKFTKPPYGLKHTGARTFLLKNKHSFSSYQLTEHLMRTMRHTDFKTTQIYIYQDLGVALDETPDFTFD
ncbi:MAG: site-specific integrase [Pedobacter sp.]|nr:MAG: site-specific integrase [Pedobacter sp.]